MSNDLIRNITAEVLIVALQNTDDESERVLMLQRYVQQYGPVPKKYRAKVMACFKCKGGERKCDE